MVNFFKSIYRKTNIIFTDRANFAFRLNIYFSLIIILSLAIMGYVSIIIISSITISNAKETSASLIRQTAKNIDILFSQIDKNAVKMSADNEICTLLRDYNKAKDESTQINIGNRIDNLLENYIKSDVEFTDAFIYNDKKVFYYGEGANEDFLDKYAVKKFKEANKNSLWIDTYESDHKNTSYISARVITLMKSMYLLSNLTKVGTLMINIPESYLDNALKDVKLGNGGRFFIVGANHNIVFDPNNKESNGSILKDTYLSKVYTNNSGDFRDIIDGQEYLIIYSKVERTNWKIVGMIPLEGITKDIYKTVALIIFIISLILVIGSIFIGFTTRKISNILQKMVESRTEELQNTLEDLKKIQVQLATKNKVLEEHAKAIEELAIIKERNRFAQDVHDTLGQTMTILISQLEITLMDCTEKPGLIKEKINHALFVARSGLNDIRRTVKGLMPKTLEINNLLGALKSLFDEYERSGIKIDLYVDGNADYKSPVFSNVIYRICQESLTNSIKHGKASKVDIIMEFSETLFKMYIFDSGYGCKNIVPNCGLTGMQRRVESLNGIIKYGSDGESGFNISVEIPIEGSVHL